MQLSLRLAVIQALPMQMRDLVVQEIEDRGMVAGTVTRSGLQDILQSIGLPSVSQQLAHLEQRVDALITGGPAHSMHRPPRVSLHRLRGPCSHALHCMQGAAPSTFSQ